MIYGVQEKYKITNFGFQAPSIDKNHYIAGDGRLLGAKDINPSGDYERWLPIYEPQAEKFETYGCTAFGATSQVETMINYIYGIEPNYSDRYLYNIVGINPPGTDPQLPYEALRTKGLVLEGVLPMTNTLEEYRTPRPMTKELTEQGKKWLGLFFFDHDWIITGKESKDKQQEILRRELKKSPLAVSVTAWYQENGVYVDNGQRNTHWCVLYKMDSEFYYVFDSYGIGGEFKKKLPFSHNIEYAKRIVLYKGQTPKDNWLLGFIKQGITWLLSFVK